MKLFAPSNWTKEPPSAVYRTPIRPSQSVPMSPQQPYPVAYSLSRSGTSLKLGAPNWVPPVGKNVTLGALRVGLIPLFKDYYAVPRVLVRKLHPEVFPWGRCPSASLHRTPQLGNDKRKGYPILRWCPILKPTPPTPPWGGQWGGLSAPNSMLPLTMGRDQSGRKDDSTLWAVVYDILKYFSK